MSSGPENPMSDASIRIQPLFNPADEEWVVLTGRYILNMGVIEFATRLLVSPKLRARTPYLSFQQN
jgi:hypothetical protein